MINIFAQQMILSACLLWAPDRAIQFQSHMETVLYQNKLNEMQIKIWANKFVYLPSK